MQIVVEDLAKTFRVSERTREWCALRGLNSVTRERRLTVDVS